MANKIETLENRSGDLVYPISQTVLSNTISTNSLADGAVTSAKLPGQIPATKIADKEIKVGDIASQAVTTAKIADGAVGTDDIAAASVTTAKILDGTFVTADFAANAVTSAKMSRSNDAVTFTVKRENSNSQNLSGRKISLGSNLYMYTLNASTSSVQTAANTWTHFFLTFPAFTSVYAYYVHGSVAGNPGTTTGYTNLDSTSQIQFYLYGSASTFRVSATIIGTI